MPKRCTCWKGVLTILACVLLLSCARSSTGPILPAADPAQTARASDSSQGRAVWGLWDVTIDPSSGTIEAVPLRGAEFKANVTMFLQPPAGKTSNLKFENLDLTDYFTEGVLTLDVGLTHPFPGLDVYTGFDVMGAFMHDGSYISSYDPGATWGRKGVDAVLLNADGYTRWFNALEFPKPGILGYTPGAMGSKNFTPGATLNPFKYFADGLDVDEDLSAYFSDPYNCENRGCFRVGSTNKRHYILQFPMAGGAPVLKFQYGVFAGWEPPEEEEPGYPISDFPISANMPEALVLSGVSSESDLYYIDDTTKGGTLRLVLEILDQQGAVSPLYVTGDIAGIAVESPDALIPGGYEFLDQTELELIAQPGGPLSSVYTIDIPNCEPSGAGEKPLLVTVLSSSPSDYNSGIAGFPYPEGVALAAFWTGTVLVSDTVANLPPVGGDLSLYWDCTGDPCSGQAFTVEISEAYDPEGEPVTITWDFDGDLDYADDMDGDDTNLSGGYKYDLPGSYECRCRISDGVMNTDVGPFDINVLDCIPDSPTLVKTVPDSTPLGLEARKIAYNPDGGYVYVCPHYSGAGYVTIVDVDPIEDAHVVNMVDVPCPWIATIEYANGYVYTSGGANYGVMTVDVDPPETASCVNQWNPGWATGSMEDMHVVGDYLYVAAQWWGLMVFDLTDPAAPAHLGHTGTAHAFTSSVMVTPDNKWGFTTDGYHNSGYLSWINIVDLSNPSSPTIVKSLQIQDYDVLPTQCDVAGDYLYVVYHPWTGTPYLTVVDISDPTNPVKVTDFNVGTGTWDVEVVGDYAYVSMGSLEVVDVSDPTAPVLLSSVDVFPECRGSAIYCGTAYIGSDLVDIIDLY